MNSLQGQESPENTHCGEVTSMTIIVQNLVRAILIDENHD